MANKRLKPDAWYALYAQEDNRPPLPTSSSFDAEAVMPPVPYCTREWAASIYRRIEPLEESWLCSRFAVGIIDNVKNDAESVFRQSFLEHPGAPDRLKPWLCWCVVYLFMSLLEPLRNIGVCRRELPVLQPVVETLEEFRDQDALWRAVCLPTTAGHAARGPILWRRPDRTKTAFEIAAEFDDGTRAEWTALLRTAAWAIVNKRRTSAKWEESFRHWFKLLPQADITAHVKPTLWMWWNDRTVSDRRAVTAAFKEYVLHLFLARIQRVPKTDPPHPLFHSTVCIKQVRGVPNGPVWIQTPHHVWRLPFTSKTWLDIRPFLFGWPRDKKFPYQQYMSYRITMTEGKKIPDRIAVAMDKLLRFVQCRSFPHFMFWLSVRCLPISCTLGFPLPDDLWMIVAAYFFI